MMIGTVFLGLFQVSTLYAQEIEEEPIQEVEQTEEDNMEDMPSQEDEQVEETNEEEQDEDIVEQEQYVQTGISGSSTNAYFESMAASDKAKINNGSYLNYYMTVDGNTYVAYGYNKNTDFSSGLSYSLKVNGNSASNAEYNNLCANPLNGSWYNTWETRYMYLRNTIYWIVKNGYSINGALVENQNYAQRAISLYGIEESKVYDALRLATQMAIWYISDTSSISLQFGWHSDYKKSMGDPIFYLAGEIAYQAYQDSTSSPGGMYLDIYSGNQNILVTRMGDMTSTYSTIEGSVQLQNGDLQQDQFEFILYDENGTEMQRTTNNEDGTFSFLPIYTFVAGTKNYKIQQVKKEDISISYDMTSLPVTITTIGNSNVSSTVNYPDSNVLKNKVKEDGGQSSAITIHGTKVLKNATLKENQFTFILYDEKGNEVQRTTNKEDGTFQFNPIDFEGVDTGIYTYTIQELNDHQKNITYDKNTVQIRIGVERGVVADEFSSKKYYASNVGYSGYEFFMSENVGGDDIRVYCLDKNKNAPSGAETRTYWIADVDPSEEILQQAVSQFSGTASNGHTYYPYDGWVDDLKPNLSKMLYYLEYINDLNLPQSSKQSLIWNMSMGEDSTPITDNNKEFIYNVIKNIQVPNQYKLVLFHSEDGTYQPFITILDTGKAEKLESQPVVFENTYNGPTLSTSVNIQKTLDGTSPKNHTFTFELLNEKGDVLETQTNDTNGKITFSSLLYTTTGTYSYKVREVDDQQENIKYDDQTYSFHVVVDDNDFFDLDSTYYYGIDLQTNGINDFYIGKNIGDADFKVYCINDEKLEPSSTSRSDVKYVAVENPTDEVIEKYVKRVSNQGYTSKYLRQCMYYFKWHPELSLLQRNEIVWGFSGTTSWLEDYTDVVKEIKNLEVPETFKLVLFIPYNSSLTSQQSGMQALIGGYGIGNDATSITFKNTTNQNLELPETGGMTTTIYMMYGMSLLLIAMFMKRKGNL